MSHDSMEVHATTAPVQGQIPIHMLVNGPAQMTGLAPQCKGLSMRQYDATMTATTPLDALEKGRQEFRQYFVPRLSHNHSQGQTWVQWIRQLQPTVHHIVTELHQLKLWALQGLRMGRHVDMSPRIAAMPTLLQECMHCLNQCGPLRVGLGTTLTATATMQATTATQHMHHTCATVMYRLATLGAPQHWVPLFCIDQQNDVLQSMTRAVGYLLYIAHETSGALQDASNVTYSQQEPKVNQTIVLPTAANNAQSQVLRPDVCAPCLPQQPGTEYGNTLTACASTLASDTYRNAQSIIVTRIHRKRSD